MLQSPTGRIRLTRSDQRLRVHSDDRILADTRTAIELHERGYPVRVYIPRDDVTPGVLAASETQTHCPFKGDATYYHVQVDGQTLTDGAWSYEQPIEEMTAIADFVAFDHERITLDSTAL